MSARTMKWLIGFAAWVALSGCGEPPFRSEDENGGCYIQGILLYPSSLPKVGESYRWEAWIDAGDGPVSVGTFDVKEGKERYSFDIDCSLGENAETFILTLEPKPDDDEGPSDWKFLAAEFDEETPTANFVTAPAFGAELGEYFDDATGSYVLSTPSSSPDDDDTQGIWFVDNSSGEREAGLDVPKLPEESAWVYEGWVVDDDGPISTGQFRNPAEPDDDAAGPAAGDDTQGYAFPGQDFVKEGGEMLASGHYEAFVSLEPDDGVEAPFAVQLLAADVPADISAAEVQSMTSTIDSPPTVNILFEGRYKQSTLLPPARFER